jgi:hypothetical protein
MYMRYAGGGVGHYKVSLTDTPANANEAQEVDDDVMSDPPRMTNLELEELEAERIEDHCSDSEGDEDDEENPDEDDLGAEDGEGGFIDAEDDEGYAAL